MSIAYRLFDEFSLPLLFACVVFAHRLSRIRPRCCHCLSLIVHFLRCSPQSRHRASHVTHSPRTAHVAHRRSSIAHCLSLTSPIVYRPSPIVYRPLSIAHRPLSTSTTFKYYTALKLKSKSHFYGRAAAEEIFSEVI